LNGDSVFCYEAKLELTAQVRDAQIRWQDGSTSPNYTVRQAGQYTVTASNNCGTVSQTITVRNAICGLNLPNAFTPNNDGLNDLFRVKYPQFIRTFDMKIYDRWGQLVFHANDPLTGWDGNFKNTKLPSGNYIWNITISDLDGNFSRKTGTVMLIR
jgi:gliding motility-associated-like protein